MKIHLPVILLLLGFVGCASNNITEFTELDITEKSITVPPGGNAISQIKKDLKASGWIIKIDSESLKTMGEGGSEIDQTSTIESSTRYRMLTAFTSVNCMTCSCVRSYNISIVDNKSGEEVVAFDAKNDNGICYKDVSERVVGWMNQQ